MALPLLTRVADDDVDVRADAAQRARRGCRVGATTRRRSHADRARPAPASSTASTSTWAQCIGCKCCVVACNEQNGNPAAINWRRVGEIEGGLYPERQRARTSRWAATTASSRRA